jgi:chromosome segregation ATPase
MEQIGDGSYAFNPSGASRENPSMHAKGLKRKAIAVVGLIVFILLTGCLSKTYEYRSRTDGSGEVAVVRSIQETYPEFAKEFSAALDGLDVEALKAKLGHAELKDKITRLYEEKDQLNAQLHDFITSRYQSYINSELDVNSALREKGRSQWNQALERVHSAALKIREKRTLIEEKAKKVSETKKKLEAANTKNELAKQKVQQEEKIYTAVYDQEAKARHKDNPDAEAQDKLAHYKSRVQDARQNQSHWQNALEAEDKTFSTLLKELEEATQISRSVGSILADHE